MILITLGTQDKQFTRLLDMVQKEINKGNIINIFTRRTVDSFV